MSFDFSGASAGASAGSAFGPWGTVIGGIAGGFLGGGSKGPSAAKQMQMQINSQYELAKNLPAYQVAGLRAAGLNPMLAATKGLPGGQMPTSGVVDDRAIDLQSATAKSQIMNQLAQSKLFTAQAEKTEAETESERERPANISADTSTKVAMTPKIEQDTRTSYAQMQQHGSTSRLQDQLARTEEWKTKTAIVNQFFRELEYDLAKSNLGPRQVAELRKISAEARSAETEADLNESLRELERAAGIAGKITGSARSVFNFFRKKKN